MSTKQAVIFAFMIIFLIVMVVTLGMWFHFSTELDDQQKTLLIMEDQRLKLKRGKDALIPVIQDPEKGLNEQINKVKTAADERETLVYTNPTEGRKMLYEQQAGKLQTDWNQAKTDWETVYDEWKKRNAKIKTAMEGLEKLRTDNEQQVEQTQKELAEELKNEESENKKNTLSLRKWREEIDGVRVTAEEVQDKINSVTRDIERSPDEESDGVVIFSDPNQSLVTVDIGSDQGARTGMRFAVYSGRYKVPKKKGEIVIARVHATSSDAIIVAIRDKVLEDPNTGWVAPDDSMRISPLTAAGADNNEAQQLVEKKSKKDLVEQMRIEKLKKENPDFDPNIAAQAAPPVQLAKGFDPIVEGDYIVNPEFNRIVTNREFQRSVVTEMLSLKDINAGSLTFYVADVIRPFRKEFLKRLCERNRCKVAPEMSSNVDFVITTADSASIAMLEERLKTVPKDKADVPPDIANRRKTLEAMTEGRKWGVQVLTEDELEGYFLKRQRKVELAKGNVKQPGQHTFFVVGETKLRSAHETGLYIKERGGVMAQKLGQEVDYVVVGSGLTDAKYDQKTNRLYYANEQAPADAQLFFDVVRSLGLKILREEELAHFFGEN
ncbi:MAG: hypothetical protein KIS92_22000 [Planctomycetota bacterium]|nr:hypothetical protein [Planctomycetota bacterium]